MTQVAADALGLPVESVTFRLVRDDALARGGANDLAEAMRHIGEPIEATAASKTGDASKRFSMHSFGGVFVEVTVDPDLAQTRVRRIVGAYGAGRIINPKTSRSQCIGGMIGGIGMALMEHSVVDPRNGRVTNANFAEYAVPVQADAPADMDVTFLDEHDPHVNPLGVKGLGEIAIVGVAAAIGNAVFHATGRRVRELPITPDKLL
jgi:xanthine dehydrogenase YagR molybdenum-binding subunit